MLWKDKLSPPQEQLPYLKESRNTIYLQEPRTEPKPKKKEEHDKHESAQKTENERRNGANRILTEVYSSTLFPSDLPR